MGSLPIETLTREERLSDRVAKQLENLIVAEVLRTEERLPAERELAEMFGVSRTVVREAMQKLSARGLLDVRTGHGAYVTAPSPDAVAHSLTLLLRLRGGDFLVEDLHDVRRVLEIAIAERAAMHSTEEDVAELAILLEQLDQSEGDHASIGRLDVEFHRALAVGSHNPLFLILLDSIGEILQTIRRVALEDPETYQKSQQHHHRIFEAVRSKDPQQAREAMAAHLDQSEATIRGLVKSQSPVLSQLLEAGLATASGGHAGETT
jgi:DNA-binding FadR family transcriptional regulator